MGYTNYWKRTDKEYDESFVDLVKDVFSSCKQKGITLRDGFGEGEPVADLTDIWFNGDGSKGLDHETFLIPNTSSENFEEGFNFCKTAAKPYDYAVKEVLRLAEKYGYVTDVSDDGEVDVVSDAEYLGESYKRESVTDEYIEITMYDGDVRRYNRDTDLEKFQYDWSNDIRDLVGDDVSSGEIDDIARKLFYYEIPNTDDELTDDDIYEMIRQILEYDLPNPNADNDAWKLYADDCKPKKKSKRKQMLTQRCGSYKKESVTNDLDIDMWYGDEFVPKKYGADAYFNDLESYYWGWIYDDSGKKIGDYTTTDSTAVSKNFQIAWNESYVKESAHTDLVNKIYSVMMNYEYGYDPDMSDINAMLQELVITNGIDNIKSNAFKKAWILAHNKAERKTWGNSGDAMKYDSLTSTEQDAIDNFDEDYWKRWRK